MRTLAVVPARAGSKGIPGKNRRLFMGKSLVQWAVECGQRTCNRVCLTTDDPEILAMPWGPKVEVLERPSDLAQDDTPMLDVLRHVLAMVVTRASDAVVLLQPTQPLRTDEQVRLAIEMLEHRPNADSIVSLVEIPAHCSPDWAVTIESGLMSLSIPTKHMPTRRQDCRKAYYRDGTVYAIRSELLRMGKLYGRALPLVLTAKESCTVDSEDDWAQAERLWRERQ